MAQNLVMVTRGKQGLEPIDIAYFAGVMDSDGCFSISKAKAGIQKTKTPRYVFNMTVVNTSEKMMCWLVEKFGGRYKTRRKMSENHKTTFDWNLSNGTALWLLKLVEPYLVAKRAQSKVALDFLENWVTNHGRGTRIDEQEVARRESCYQEMKWLNKFGPVQPQRLSPLAPHEGDAIV